MSCDICTEPRNDTRYLNCNHGYCMTCVEGIEAVDGAITCPTCKEDTVLPPGLHVTHLRKRLVRSKSRDTLGMPLIHSWSVTHQVEDVAIDDVTGVVYLGTCDPIKPIKMYSMTGHYTGHLKADRNLFATRLAVDTKRGLLLAIGLDGEISAIVMFDREGTQVGAFHCEQFIHMNSIAYHIGNDVYIVADIDAHCLYYVDPNAEKVVKTIPALTDEELHTDTTMSITCDKTGTVSTWATCDWIGTIVRLYDADGACIKVWDNKGRGLNQLLSPDGIYMDSSGHLLVSDCDNHRIVRLRVDKHTTGGAQEQSHVVVYTGQYCLGNPRAIDVSMDGLAVVLMWADHPGPHNVALLNGLLG